MSYGLISTVGTVGHFNSAVALARLLAEDGWDCDIVTGSAIQDYALPLAGQISGTVHCLAAFDLDLDRSRPDRRSHFQQVYDPDHVAASASELRRLIGTRRPQLIVTKDFVSPRLCAAEAGIPSALYMTDGVEPLVMAHRLRKAPLTSFDQAAFLAALDRIDLPRMDAMTKELTLARGYRRTSLVPAGQEAMLEDVVFLGGLVFDGPAEIIDAWRLRLSDKPRPFGFLTFGTVNGDGNGVRRIAMAASRQLASMLMTHLPGLDDATPSPSNLQCVRYVPNEAALDVADVVIHHGGHGTMLSALKSGVPAIAMPINTMTSAQGLHAEVLAALGVGRTLAFDADADAIGAAITWATSADVRERCASLRDELVGTESALRTRALAGIREFADRGRMSPLSRGPP